MIAQDRFEKLYWVITCLLALSTFSFYSFNASLYHAQASFYTSLSTELLVLLIFLTPVLTASLAFKNIKFTQFASMQIIFFAIYKLVITRNIVSHFDVRLEKKLILISISIILAAIFIYVLTAEAWRLLQKIIFVFSAGWLLSNPLTIYILSRNLPETTPVLNIGKILENPPKAVVVIVADETSPEYANYFIRALNIDHHILNTTNVKKAGKNTINAIPSMLTNNRHDEIDVCGVSKLCGSNIIDFSKLSATSAKTHVIGLYHPYCNIKGLKSCWHPKFDLDSPEHPTYHESFASKLPIIKSLSYFKNEINMNDLHKEYIINKYRRHLLESPFWSDAGLLYFHQPLPHPLGIISKPATNLHNEYINNINLAVDNVKLIQSKLIANFGNDYAIIITSDHPLRTSFWCQESGYKLVNCNNENPAEGDLVPFIVLAPKSTTVHMPTTNVGVFAN